MNVLVTGATGFVGTHLSHVLLGKGCKVTGISRARSHPRINHPDYLHIAADTTQKGTWQDWIPKSDAIVNLAGKSIFGIWTDKTKKEMYDSRILTTRNIVEAIPENASHMTLCSTSAVGYYGDRKDDLITEIEPPGNDFLADLGRDWEATALTAQKKGVRVTLARFGIVLGKGGGAIEKMLPTFRAFLGGPLGDGSQWFPWVHLDDITGGILFLMENSLCSGAFNFTAPHPVTNRRFAKTLGGILARPSIMPAPAFVIRAILGEFGGVLLSSQRAMPEKLISEGYQFKFPTLSEALREIIYGK